MLNTSRLHFADDGCAFMLFVWSNSPKCTARSSQMSFLCVCWGPSSISRHALGEFFSCVDCLLLLPSVKNQVILIQALQKFFLHQQRVWKMLSTWLFFHDSPVLERWEVIWPLSCSDLSRHPFLAPARSVCSWTCPQSGTVALTLGGGV